MSKINEILDGWGNLVKAEFNLLNPEILKMSQQRLELCHSCDMRSGNTCSRSKKGKHVVTGLVLTGCGCNLSAKPLSPTSKCPLGKW